MFNILKQKLAAFLPTSLKSRLKNVLNTLHPTETIDKSKEKWNRLADENARYYVMSKFGKAITDSQFSESGLEDYRTLIKEDAILSSLAPFKYKKILEIGCGSGRMTEYIADDFLEVCGIDISDEMISQAKARLTNKTNVQLIATDGIAYPFPDNYFDIVFSYIVFQHMPDKKTVEANLHEIARVLKHEGIAKVQLRGAPVEKGKWFYGPSFTEKESRELVALTGLNVIQIEGAGTRELFLWMNK